MAGPDRRSLLRGAAALSLGALASGCRLGSRGGATVALRPPGAAPGQAFLDLCIRCGRCGLACATGCIHYDDTLGAAGSAPFIVPTERACILCMKCGEVCPTGAIVPIPAEPTAIAERVRMGTAEIDAERCWSASGKGICRACWYSCPLAGAERPAIALDGDGLTPRVDPDRCVGCGLCAQVCPPEAGAITIRPRRA
jgi:ferredoxin-type protein NapG